MDENKIIPYIEPILRFCLHRCSNRCDAEDLSSEILCHIIDGIGKYQINSLDAWVWRVAHNRYARFIDRSNKEKAVLSDTESVEVEDVDYCFVDEAVIEHDYDEVFRCLGTLSAEYRNIIVDYYIGEMPVRKLSVKYSLPETTVKWRLNDGRRKIRERMGENKMDKIYNRINWNTSCCNGNMDSDKYLHTQLARAICLAAYEKPLTVDEISIATGIPALYIEDELPRLEYGDAVNRTGNKYATDFIIFSLADREKTESFNAEDINRIADCFEQALSGLNCADCDFYGNNFGIGRLGYILIPYILRKKIREVKNKTGINSSAFPPRRDGGFGWFIVEETRDSNENSAEYSSGCNAAGDDSGSKSEKGGHTYYYWTSKYFDARIYHNGGTRWLTAKGIPQTSRNGLIADGILSDDDTVRLLKANLIIKTPSGYALNFPCFSQDSFSDFARSVRFDDEAADAAISKWLTAAKKNFEGFVPRRLHSQINQWVSYLSGQITGYVIDELVRRGTLEKPDTEKPLVNGVFFVEGEYINP